MKNINYYRGNFRKDRDIRENNNIVGHDWLVGNFMHDTIGDPRNTDTMSVKFWHFKKGEKAHKTKLQKISTECTILIKGKLKARIESEEFEFIEGEYIVIHPNVESNLAIVALEDCEGITIKAPSLSPDDTVKLD